MYSKENNILFFGVFEYCLGVLICAYVNESILCQSNIIAVLILLRTVKTQTNRVYRDNVLGTQNNSKKNKEISVITRLQYEEVITS